MFFVVGLGLGGGGCIGFDGGLGLGGFKLGGGGFRLDRCGDFGAQELGHFPSQVDHLGTEVVKLVLGDHKHVPVVFFQALMDRPSCLGEVPCELEKSLVSLFVEHVFGLVPVKFEWFGAVGVFGLVVLMYEGGNVVFGGHIRCRERWGGDFG